MADPVTRAANPEQDATVNRELLAEMDDLPRHSRGGLEDFTEDRYPTSAVALSLAESRGSRVHRA